MIYTDKLVQNSVAKWNQKENRMRRVDCRCLWLQCRHNYTAISMQHWTVIEVIFINTRQITQCSHCSEMCWNQQSLMDGIISHIHTHVYWTNVYIGSFTTVIALKLTEVFTLAEYLTWLKKHIKWCRREQPYWELDKLQAPHCTERQKASKSNNSRQNCTVHTCAHKTAVL